MRRNAWIAKQRRKKELAVQNYQFHRAAVALGNKIKDRRNLSMTHSVRNHSNNCYHTSRAISSGSRLNYIVGSMPLIVGFSAIDIECERGLL